MILIRVIKTMGNLETLKIFGFNAVAAFLSTFTNLDIILKRALILATIIYTIVKAVAVVREELRKSRRRKKAKK